MSPKLVHWVSSLYNTIDCVLRPVVDVTFMREGDGDKNDNDGYDDWCHFLK